MSILRYYVIHTLLVFYSFVLGTWFIVCEFYSLCSVYIMAVWVCVCARERERERERARAREMYNRRNFNSSVVNLFFSIASIEYR